VNHNIKYYFFNKDKKTKTSNFWRIRWEAGAGNILGKWSEFGSEAIINKLSIPDLTRPSEIRRDNSQSTKLSWRTFFGRD